MAWFGKKGDEQPQDGPKVTIDDRAQQQQRLDAAEVAREREGGRQHNDKLAANREDRAKRADGLQQPAPVERMVKAQLEPYAKLLVTAPSEPKSYKDRFSEKGLQKLEAERARTQQQDKDIVAGKRPTPEQPIGMLAPKSPTGPSR